MAVSLCSRVESGTVQGSGWEVVPDVRRATEALTRGRTARRTGERRPLSVERIQEQQDASAVGMRAGAPVGSARRSCDAQRHPNVVRDLCGRGAANHRGYARMGTDARRARAGRRRAGDAHQASVGVRARTPFLDAAECGKVRRMVPALLEGATRTGLSRDVAETP